MVISDDVLPCKTRSSYAQAIRDLSRVPSDPKGKGSYTCAKVWPDGQCHLPHGHEGKYATEHFLCDSCNRSRIEGTEEEDDGYDCPGCSQCGPPIMVTAEEGCLR